MPRPSHKHIIIPPSPERSLRQHTWLLCLLGMAANGTGCAPLYSNPAVNAPLLEKPGDVVLRAMAGTNGGDLHAAVALTDTIAAAATASAAHDTDQEHAYLEAAAGTYKAEGRRRTSISAGLGGGNFRTCGGFAFGPVGVSYKTSEPFDGDACGSGTLMRAFGQAAVGFTGNVIDVGFVGRLNVDHMTGVEGTYNNDFWDEGGTRLTLPKSSTVAHLQPFGYFRIGPKAVRLEVQAGLSLPLTSVSDMVPSALPFHFALGVLVPIQ